MTKKQWKKAAVIDLFVCVKGLSEKVKQEAQLVADLQNKLDEWEKSKVTEGEKIS